MIRLLLKTYDNHKKYLCKRESEDYLEYKGSGNNITSDLKVIDTEVLLATEDRELFKEVGIYYSKLWNVVENPLFLNMKLEEGDGGDTVSNRMWIRKGNKEKYILKSESIPNGWERGRTKSVFNDPEKQKEFNKRANHQTEKQIEASRRMGLSNKGHTNSKGGKNTQAKKIMTPYGKYDFIQDAVNKLGITRRRILKNISNEMNKEWYFL